MASRARKVTTGLAIARQVASEIAHMQCAGTSSSAVHMQQLRRRRRRPALYGSAHEHRRRPLCLAERACVALHTDRLSIGLPPAPMLSRRYLQRLQHPGWGRVGRCIDKAPADVKILAFCTTHALCVSAEATLRARILARWRNKGRLLLARLRRRRRRLIDFVCAVWAGWQLSRMHHDVLRVWRVLSADAEIPLP